MSAAKQSHGLPGLLRPPADIALRVPFEYLAEFRRDVRYGFRALAASPGFTAVALVSPMLGIGVATASFSEMNGFGTRGHGVRGVCDRLRGCSRGHAPQRHEPIGADATRGRALVTRRSGFRLLLRSGSALDAHRPGGDVAGGVTHPTCQ